MEDAGDAWAKKRLSAEEFADAVVLDQQMKRHWKQWLGTYFVIVVTGTVLVNLIAPKFGWARPFVVVNLFCIGILGVFLSAWYGYRKYTGPRRMRTYALFIAMLFAGGITGAFVASLDGGRPITEMSAQKAATIFGVVSAIGVGLILAIATIAYVRTREVAARIALLQAEADRERLSRQSVQAELKLLQAQVEPHFLFNTLANLRFLVQTQSPNALSMLDHLIHYLRTALPEIRAESSTVGREIELTRAYLEILRIRMGGALEISTDIQAGLAGVAFPPLVVLTLVENAIKHGVAPLGRGHVRVAASSEGARLTIRVEDDGRGMVEPIGQGVGLANVRERLRAIYGATARIELTGRPEGGTIAAIEVPL
jgi:signal transduction histidine kinase